MPRSSQKLSGSSTELARLVVISGGLNKSSISLTSGGWGFTAVNKLSKDKLSGADGFIFDVFTLVGITSTGKLVSVFADKKELSKLI